MKVDATFLFMANAPPLLENLADSVRWQLQKVDPHIEKVERRFYEEEYLADRHPDAHHYSDCDWHDNRHCECDVAVTTEFNIISSGVFTLSGIFYHFLIAFDDITNKCRHDSCIVILKCVTLQPHPIKIL